MRNLTLLFLAALLCAQSHAQTDINTMNVSGTWTLAGSPYHIHNNIFVQANNSLVIQPGVEVVFHGPYYLNVMEGGVMHAVGSKEAGMITFRADDTTGWWNTNDTAGGWNGITYSQWNYSGTDWSAFQYCIVKDVKHSSYSVFNHSALRCSRALALRHDQFFHNQSQNNHGSGVVVMLDHGTANTTFEIDSCEFHHNYAHFTTLQVGNGSPTNPYLIHRNKFHHNGGYGNTIWFTGATAALEDNEIAYNSSDDGQCAVMSYGHRIQIRRNRIHHNHSHAQAAIASLSGFMDIDNNLICNNDQDKAGCLYGEGGGGIHVMFNNNPDYKDSTYYRIRNNVIANNTAVSGGAGIFVYNCKALIANNTIINNKSESSGGGIMLWNTDAHVDIRNNIFYGNLNNPTFTGLAATHDIALMTNTPPVKVDYNWMETPMADAVQLATGTSITGDVSHNLSGSTPGLLQMTGSAGHLTDATTTIFSLLATSPCLNNGDGANSDPTATDYENTARMEGVIDRGAYEYGSQHSQGIFTPQNAGVARLSAYPNPATGTFTVMLPEANGTLILTDGVGRMVRQAPVSALLQLVDVALLPAGLYLVQWQREGRILGAGKVEVR